MLPVVIAGTRPVRLYIPGLPAPERFSGSDLFRRGAHRARRLSNLWQQPRGWSV